MYNFYEGNLVCINLCKLLLISFIYVFENNDISNIFIGDSDFRYQCFFYGGYIFSVYSISKRCCHCYVIVVFIAIDFYYILVNIS